MNSSSNKETTIIKRLKSATTALMRAGVLAGMMLLSTSPAPAAIIPSAAKKSIRQRVELVRETLTQKVANDKIPISKLSFSEIALAQWGNWGNWGNWNNWINWNNWNNWRNWGNWGNWGNF